MTSDTPLAEALLHLSKNRFRRFGRLPLRDFRAARERFMQIDADMARLLHARREEVLQLLADDATCERWVAMHAQRLGDVAYRHNQFLSPTDLADSPATPIYRQLFKRLRTTLAASPTLPAFEEALFPVLAAHHDALWRWSTGLLEERFGDALAEPVCSEYSAELQCRVLGIDDAAALMEPILDLGCGEAANLVRHLRAQGLSAWGLDRLAAPSDHILQGDWLEPGTPLLAPGRWGTVVSHMAFSNHFQHQHLRQEGSSAESYAARYIQVLRALQPGGRFFYAPSLPFFEALLPRSHYRVTRRPVEGTGMEASEVRRLD